MKYFLISLRIVLAAMFLYAAIGKLLLHPPTDPDNAATLFEVYVGAYPVLRYAFIAYEIALSLWLLSGIKMRAAALVALITLAVFSAVIGLEFMTPNPRACGCAGPITPGSNADLRRQAIYRDLTLALARNLALMLAAAILFDRAKRPTLNVQRKTPNVGRPTSND